MAADMGLSHRMDGIAADGAHIEAGFQHVRAHVVVLDSGPGQKLGNGHAQSGGDRLEQRDVGISGAGFPFLNRLIANAQNARELRLRHAALFAQLFDRRTGQISIHLQLLAS